MKVVLNPAFIQPLNLFSLKNVFSPPCMFPKSSPLTRELQSKALFAGEEVCGELEGDGVKGAVSVWRQCWAAQLPQQDPSILGPVPDPKHIMDLLGVENQEMQTGKEKKG